MAEACAIRNKQARDEVRVRLGDKCQVSDHVSLVDLDKETKFIFLSVEGSYRIKGFKQGVT